MQNKNLSIMNFFDLSIKFFVVVVNDISGAYSTNKPALVQKSNDLSRTSAVR